jgi:cation:H+ antiporter
LVFAVSAAAIWWAGTRLEHHAGIISERTGLGQAFTGMLLLAGATSLPELATTVTAVAVLKNPTLAVNNLLGGVALQTVLLAVADAVKRRRAPLTSCSPSFGSLVQGVGLMLLLSIVIAGATASGEPAVFGISAWLVLLLAVYVGIMYVSYRQRNSPRWVVADQDGRAGSGEARSDEGSGDEEGGRHAPVSLRRTWLSFAALSLVVLVGGWFATHSAEALAQRTGLGSAFMGATLLALATSLPELSTTIAASRRGRYTTAISNIFGSNAVDVVLLVLAEALFFGGTILAQLEKSMVFVASLGAVLTCVYVLGLLGRGNRTVLTVGWDSAAAVLLYSAGMVVLYTMSAS